MKWKQAIGALVALILVLTACGASSVAANREAEAQRLAKVAAEAFTDVAADAEYAAAVGWCLENGLMNGVSDTEFFPDGTLNRAMVATILYRAEEEPPVTGQPPFTDTEPDTWYSDAVVWTNDKGILLGYGNGLFGTADPVSVEQLEVILGRYTGDGPEWVGDSAKAIPAARAQAAMAFYEAMKPEEPAPESTRRPSGGGSSGGGGGGGSVARPTPTPTPTPMPTPDQTPGGSNILVAYFSAQGHTRPIAQEVARAAGADLFEIVPAQPYTDADLNYSTDCRANDEQNDPAARPAIATAVENMDQYDAVLIGYPIWWGRAPKIIHTFLESYDLGGKTVATFCTSGGSGHEDASIRDYAPEATWLTGRRFTSTSQVEAWIDTLGLESLDTAGREYSVAEFDLASGVNGSAPTVTLNSGYQMPVAGLGTYSLHDETCVNSVRSALDQGVRLIDTAYMYGNEKEVGQAVREFIAETGTPREEIFVITKLYPGEQFSNPEKAIQDALDKLDIGYIDMMLLHHPGANDVKAYQAMEQAVADGKIRSLGLSNWYIEEIDDFIAQVSIKPALVQNEIHPYYQEQEVIAYMHDLGIAMQAWYPLGGRGHQQELLSDSTLSEIAQVHGVSVAQVILRWDLQNGVVVIPGSSNPDHILENISLFDFELSEEEMAAIAALDRGEKHDWY